MQGYDTNQITKEKVQWRSQPIIVNYFLFSLSPLSLESYNQFVSRWVKELKIEMSLNHLLKLPWLLDGSVRNVFPSSLYCSIQIRCIVFIVSAKIPEGEGSILSPSFYGQLPTINHKCQPYLPSRWVPLFVPAVPSPQTYTAASGVA